MELRAALVALVAVATIGFVVGTTIERNSGETHQEAPVPHAETSGEAGGETEEDEAGHTDEGTGAPEPATERAGHSEELKPFGIDIEAAAFVALAAAASLALALVAWLRPGHVPMLVAVAATMALVAFLDVREVFHQSDGGRAGLVVLAAAIAALHLAAAGVAGAMARRAPEASGSAATPAT